MDQRSVDLAPAAARLHDEAVDARRFPDDK
jgi:hypothetical protein